ncbi:iron-siderophore ABC transporter substrate-binding protein [Amycolatopsis sp. cg5]|uniref:iron-siderophore ABC transporter substrate-binding protein n=1 Tax=Amycolatopsis sp. cg5 TaxID=3238802 RepID=UPI003525F3E4
MSRRLLAGLTAGALALSLVACGNVEDKPTTPAAGSSSAQPGAFPVTITHKFGSTTVAKAPERVVVVGTYTDDLDAALALGVTPVGFFSDSQTQPDGVATWLKGKLDPAKTKIVNTGAGLDPEQVGKLNPDLILASAAFGLDKVYENLNKIAPTIGYEKEWGGQSWQQHVQVVGKALGKAADADKLIADTTAQITKVKTDNAKAAGKTFTVSVGNTPGKIFTLASKDDFAVKFIEELGMQLSPSALTATKETAGSPTGSLSPEQYDKLGADLIVIAYTGADLQKAVEDNQLVKDLPAIKKGNYLVIDMEAITQLRAPTLLGIPSSLQKLNAAMQKIG